MNIELLNRVKAHILEEPKRYFMPTYLIHEAELSEVNKRELAGRFPACGTMGCFAGWICALSGVDTSTLNARRLADLDFDQAHRLFLSSPETWSHLDRDKLWSGDGTPETAALAAKRLDLFIESGGAI